MRLFALLLLVLGPVALLPASAAAAEPVPSSEEAPRRPEPLIPEITVIGSKEAVDSLTGSGYFADVNEIQGQGYDDGR